MEGPELRVKVEAMKEGPTYHFKHSREHTRLFTLCARSLAEAGRYLYKGKLYKKRENTKTKESYEIT